MAISEREKLERAKQRMELICGFYAHVAVFVIVNSILFAVNAMGGSQWWIQWSLLGWGAGLLVHAFLIYGQAPAFVRRWQVRQIKKIKDAL